MAGDVRKGPVEKRRLELALEALQDERKWRKNGSLQRSVRKDRGSPTHE